MLCSWTGAAKRYLGEIYTAANDALHIVLDRAL